MRHDAVKDLCYLCKSGIMRSITERSGQNNGTLGRVEDLPTDTYVYTGKGLVVVPYRTERGVSAKRPERTSWGCGSNRPRNVD
jgi:hypothetical protein